MIQFDPKTGNTRKIRRVGKENLWGTGMACVFLACVCFGKTDVYSMDSRSIRACKHIGPTYLHRQEDIFF